MYRNGIKGIIKVLTDSVRCRRLRTMYNWLLVVLWHLLIRQVVVDQFGTAELCRRSTLTQLRVGLIHLLRTQTAIGVDECAA